MQKQKEFLNTKTEQVSLNKEAGAMLLEMLENPPEPNKKLIKAAKKYRSTNKS